MKNIIKTVIPKLHREHFMREPWSGDWQCMVHKKLFKIYIMFLVLFFIHSRAVGIAKIKFGNRLTKKICF